MLRALIDGEVEELQLMPRVSVLVLAAMTTPGCASEDVSWPAARGEPCDSGDAEGCPDDLVCTDQASGNIWSCQVACASDDDCPSGNAEYGVTCTSAGICDERVNGPPY